jgi:hypothetical protein
VAGVGSRLTGKRNPKTTRMDIVAVTALAAAVDETSPFEVGRGWPVQI